MKCLIVCLLFVAAANALFWSSKQQYSKLYVTFLTFSRLPVTKNDAIAKGWKLDKACDANNYFAGDRYVLNGDTAVMLLFGGSGVLAGMQMGVPKSVVGAKTTPWIEEGEMYVITAYFRDPGTVCGGARHETAKYGDRLLIQNGPSRTDTMKIPYKEQDLQGTRWVKGQCFPLMGQHYWYGISKDMNCEDFFPVFIMYNGKKLNGFGWDSYGDLKSSRYEHPPKDKLNYFFKPETKPQCLDTAGPLTTQHVYLDSPYNNFCYF